MPRGPPLNVGTYCSGFSVCVTRSNFFLIATSHTYFISNIYYLLSAEHKRGGELEKRAGATQVCNT